MVSLGGTFPPSAPRRSVTVPGVRGAGATGRGRLGQGKRYLFTGGGTGGHVTPNLAILTEIRARHPDASFLYVGSARGYETRVQESGVAFRAIPCAAFCSPRRPLRFLLMAARILVGVLCAMGVIIRFRPHVVVASGGYVSVPCVLAAWLLRRRIYVHEQNVHPGRANRALAHLATRVGVTFRETMDWFPKAKTTLAGYPVRRQIQEGSPAAARERFQIPPDRKVAFILGGSMGSRAINRGTVEALRTILRREDIAVIHATGLSRSGEYQAWEDTQDRLRKVGFHTAVPGRYVCKPFFKNIQDVYALADLVVARAGAGTIMELATVGKPSLLIPKSDVPGDHQLMNAMSLQKTGSAEVLFEERGEEAGMPVTRVRGDALAKKITDLMEAHDDLDRMGKRAARVAVADALQVHVDIVTGLSSNEPLVDQVKETDRVGLLLDEAGQSHELMFRSNIVGTGMLPDVRVRNTVDGRPARAVILQTRRDGDLEYHAVKRAGQVEIAGRPLEGRVALKQEDVLSIGGRRFTFLRREREIERPVATSGMSLRVAVTALGTLVSRLFGFVRDSVMVWSFGLGHTMDLMAVALQVSNYFRGVFAEQAVDTAFLPTFVHLQRTGRVSEANRLASSVLSLTVIGSGAVTVAAILTLPMWMPYLAHSWVENGLIGDAILLTQIMFPYLVLVSAAAVISAVLKACNRFATPAFSSIMFSVGVLIGVALYPVMGLPALGVGVLLGGVGQILIQLPALFSADVRRGFGVKLRPRIHLKDAGVRKVGRVTPNILADTSINRAGSMVDTILATSLAGGMVSALYFAMLIFRLPFGLISVSINTVILKELSEGQALSDRDATRRLLAGGINWTVFLLLPVSITLIVLADPIVDLLFRYLKFDAAAAGHVALALRCYAAGLVAWGLTGLCGRFFSARMEQGKSTTTSLVALGVNVLVSIVLVQHGLGIAGLALGTTTAFALCAGMRLWMLNRSLRGEGIALRASDVLPSVVQTSLATGGALLAMLVVHAAVSDFDGLPSVLNRLFVLGVPLGFGVFAFCAAGLLLRCEQVEEIVFKVGRKKNKGSTAGEPRPVNPYCMDPPQRLLGWVGRNPKQAGHYNFARRVTTFLNSREWKVRNVGIKLVGELKLQSFRYDLAEIVTCREPAALSHRLLGGDFVQPGFLRRNAIRALAQLGDPDGRTEKALLMATGDPYYEVRVEAVSVLGQWAEKLSGPAREEAIALVSRMCSDRNFEVATGAVEALGTLALDDSVVEVLKKHHYHRNWKVRDAVVRTYGRLFARRILADRTRILALLDDVLATSEGFIPRFVLKEHMTELQQALLREDRDREGTR